tara:strand:- start:9282 stop:9521 length:240 start_codon:yes stop_codon:yes gene_type:complete
MSSNVSNLQLLNNTEHRLKFRTGDKNNNNSDISDVKDAIVGEIFLLNQVSAGGHPALYVCVNTQGEIKKIYQFTASDII